MSSALQPNSSARIGLDPVALLENSGALSYGDFTLASGKKSSYYIDSKKLTMEPDGAFLVGSELVKKLDAEGIRYVGGTAYGAIPIVSHVVFQSSRRSGAPIRAFYHRKEAKGHGTNALAEGQSPAGDEPVAMLEDVVTSGDSLLSAIALAEEEGYNVTHAFTLVDRGEGGRQKVESAGYRFWAMFRVERTSSGVRVRFVADE